MKRILVIGLAIVVLSSLVGFSIPALAHGPEDGESSVNQETWAAMHEACEEGDWEAMAEAADEVHENLGYASCHSDEYPATDDSGQAYPNRWGGMGGGMMGGWGSMM